MGLGNYETSAHLKDHSDILASPCDVPPVHMRRPFQMQMEAQQLQLNRPTCRVCGRAHRAYDCQLSQIFQHQQKNKPQKGTDGCARGQRQCQHRPDSRRYHWRCGLERDGDHQAWIWDTGADAHICKDPVAHDQSPVLSRLHQASSRPAAHQVQAHRRRAIAPADHQLYPPQGRQLEPLPTKGRHPVKLRRPAPQQESPSLHHGLRPGNTSSSSHARSSTTVASFWAQRRRNLNTPRTAKIPQEQQVALANSSSGDNWRLWHERFQPCKPRPRATLAQGGRRQYRPHASESLMRHMLGVQPPLAKVATR
ncbi:hypothetical protein L1887_48606 [Cichorium endivia]|nr:hypothetical protein L1887_48606 [Cichorium endivia]